MIEARTLAFLRDLGRNNTREWYEDNRERADDARANMIDVAARLIEAAPRIDETIANADLDPRKCVSRFARDMRFAKGKPPYKPELFVMLNGVGKYQGSASYYLHVEPRHCYAGGGIFMTVPEALGKIRHRISTRFDEWQRAVESDDVKALVPDGLTAPETLQNVPRGFDKDDPAADYLKLKGFCLNRLLTHSQVESDDGLDLTVEGMAVAQPLVRFINAAAKSAR